MGGFFFWGGGAGLNAAPRVCWFLSLLTRFISVFTGKQFACTHTHNECRKCSRIPSSLPLSAHLHLTDMSNDNICEWGGGTAQQSADNWGGARLETPMEK